jgi:hypothetical protein
MRLRRALRIAAAVYFLLACLMWLALGVLTVVYRQMALSGDVRTPGDWAFMLLGWILPFVVGIYFIFKERLLWR